jgi:hypothetical protein
MLDKKSYRYAIVGLSVAVGLFLIGASLIAAVGHAVPKELWTTGTALGGGLLGVLIPSPRSTTKAKKAQAEGSAAHHRAVQAARQALKTLPKTPAREGAETQAQASARVKRKAEEAVSEVGQSRYLKLAIGAASRKPGAGDACEALALRHDTTARDVKTKAAKAAAPRKAELNAQAKVFEAAAKAMLDGVTREEAKDAVKSTSLGFSDYAGKLVGPVLVGGVALYFGTRFAGKLPARADFEYAAKLGEHVTSGQETMKHYLEALSQRQSTQIKEGDQLLALATAAGGAVVGVLAPSPVEPTSATEKTTQG